VPAVAPEYPESGSEIVKDEPIQGIANRIAQRLVWLAKCLLVAGSNAHPPSKRAARVSSPTTTVAITQDSEEDCRTQQPGNEANHLIRENREARYVPTVVSETATSKQDDDPKTTLAIKFSTWEDPTIRTTCYPGSRLSMLVRLRILTTALATAAISKPTNRVKSAASK